MTVPVCLDLTQQSAVFEKHSHSLLLVDAAESLKSTDLTQGFNRVVEASEQQACASIQGIQQQDCKQTITVVISEDAEEAAGPGPYSKLLETVRRSRKVCSYAFIAVWARQAVEDPCLRVDAFSAGANMVTYSSTDLNDVFNRIQHMELNGTICCDYCSHPNLTPTDYWHHQPLFHIYSPNIAATCQVCGTDAANLAVHLHEEHGPQGPHHELRTGVGACVVVHRPRDNKFLMIQEVAGMGYWLPGGGLDEGEGLREGALREVWEEAGVHVTLSSLLEVDYRMEGGKLLWRLVTFYGVCDEEEEKAQPKTVPDFESSGTCWVSIDDLERIPHRSPRLAKTWYPYIAEGKELPPLAIPDHLQHLFTGDLSLEL